ncbi:MAG: ORF6N domain-containing protein [Burkholderiales bacterium]|nr:ORF6N domain-containing protein [Burkholderiales bacterium]
MKSITAEHIDTRILAIRGHKVMIDADLAELYSVTTKRLNQQVRRNIERFPEDFMFELRPAEKAEVVANCIHLARLKFSPAAPLAFTEHGALMAALVLNTPRAIEVSAYVVRAFVRLNQALASHKELARRFDQLEARTDARFKAVFDALRELMTTPEPKKKHPIGFVTPKEK